jgi:hypothetical protein
MPIYNIQKLMTLKSDNLTKGIQSDLENKLGNKHAPYSGWSLIPNVNKFLVTPGAPDEKWQSVGIEKNKEPCFHVTPYYNNKLNKYIKYQVKRLDKLKTSNPRLFWTVGTWLITNSIAFRVSAINHVMKGWYKNMGYWKVIQVNRKIEKLLKDKDTDLRYRRVYIPKGDTHRPLGVPTMEWRVVLHMHAKLLDMFIKPHLLKSQHGFISGRGTLTAWQELVKKVLPAKFIYECDLQQFFPSVRTNEISKRMEALGMPKSWVLYYENINLCQPELPPDEKLDESHVHQTRQDQEDLKNDVYRPESRIYKPLQDFIDANGKEILGELFPGMSFLEIVKNQRELFGEYGDRSLPGSHVGTPQGAPTSPILSISILGDFLRQVPSISYADDPIFYSNKDFRIRDDPEKGIILHKDNKKKCKWIKRDGVWLEKLKFLGLIYDPWKDNLRASTKKGSTLLLEEDYANILNGTFDVKEVVHPYSTWVKLLSSKIAGIIQSKLYNGKWNAEEVEKEMNLVMSNDSWISKISFNYSATIFNASSFACKSLAHLLTAYDRKAKKKTIRKVMSFKVKVGKLPPDATIEEPTRSEGESSSLPSSESVDPKTQRLIDEIFPHE